LRADASPRTTVRKTGEKPDCQDPIEALSSEALARLQLDLLKAQALEELSLSD
jgi:hypothetical protein